MPDRKAAVLLCAAVLSGCAGGFDLRKAEADRSLVTNAVSGGAAPIADPAKASDEATIRNAVSSINPEALNGAQIPWANPGTGSRGAISAITEYRDKDALCRRFTASRESFEGVRLYDGDVCLHPGGQWLTRSFRDARFT